MDNLEKMLDLEMKTQSQLLQKSRETIRQSPAGYLSVRERPQKTDYYQTCKIQTANSWENKNININDDLERLHGLTEKKLAAKIEKICRENLILMKKFRKQYQSYDREVLMKALAPKYTEAVKLYREKQIKTWLSASYPKCPFDPKSHIHETVYGESVRSKSEVIIANALFGYGILSTMKSSFLIPVKTATFIIPTSPFGCRAESV